MWDKDKSRIMRPETVLKKQEEVRNELIREVVDVLIKEINYLLTTNYNGMDDTSIVCKLDSLDKMNKRKNLKEADTAKVINEIKIEGLNSGWVFNHEHTDLPNSLGVLSISKVEDNI